MEKEVSIKFRTFSTKIAVLVCMRGLFLLLLILVVSQYSSSAYGASIIGKCLKMFGLASKSNSSKPDTSVKKRTLTPEEVLSVSQQVIDSLAFREKTVALDLSNLTNASAAMVEEKISLGIAASAHIEFFANQDTSIQNFQAFMETIKTLLSAPGSYQLDKMLPLSLQSTDILDQILSENHYSGETPLIIFIRDFAPSVSEFEPFSSWVRALHNDVLTKRPIRIILSSRFPTYEWGSAQGGFNVGKHFHPK